MDARAHTASLIKRHESSEVTNYHSTANATGLPEFQSSILTRPWQSGCTIYGVAGVLLEGKDLTVES
jgi:hypothetical protein